MVRLNNIQVSAISDLMARVDGGKHKGVVVAVQCRTEDAANEMVNLFIYYREGDDYSQLERLALEKLKLNERDINCTMFFPERRRLPIRKQEVFESEMPYQTKRA